MQGLPNFFWIPPIISGTGKATDFKFCRNIHGVDRNKSPCMKTVGNTLFLVLAWQATIVAVGVVRESRKYSGHPCRGRIARSSLR